MDWPPDADFILSGGRFGTHIIQNCTKWSNVGVHGLSFGPILRQISLRLFSTLNNMKNDNIVQQTKTYSFSQKKIEKLHASHQSWKNKCSDIIKTNLMNLIMYHQIQSQYIKHYITVRTFYKKMFKQ